MIRRYEKTDWLRVRRDMPCPVCGKPDWCMIAVDESAAICARIESDKPAGNKGAGWVHRLRWEDLQLRRVEPPKTPKPKREKPDIDWVELAKKYVRQLTDAGCQYLADEIGVSPATIRTMGVGWCCSRSAWTWPMRNAAGHVVGLRTRTVSGEKAAITGTDGNGLFIGPDVTPDYLIVCEGPTDTATLIDCGYLSVIGRPSCKSGTEYVIRIVGRLRPDALLFIPDNDDDGINGCADLIERIVARHAMSLKGMDALLPPADATDARKWAKKNREDLTGTIAAKLERIKSRRTAT